MVASEQHLYQTIVQFDKTVVLPRKLPNGSIHYDMGVCGSHDAAGSLAHDVFISRPTGKVQTHWQHPDPLVGVTFI